MMTCHGFNVISFQAGPFSWTHIGRAHLITDDTIWQSSLNFVANSFSVCKVDLAQAKTEDLLILP
jgi:hypothetical protein